MGCPLGATQDYRFEAGLLTVFNKADTDGDEARITEIAAASRHVCLSLHLHDSRNRDSGAARGEWDSWWKYCPHCLQSWTLLNFCFALRKC